MLRVLIADDDAISLRFLQSALQQLDCAAVGTASLGEALTAATGTAFDLLLFDRNMPGGGGMELLATLRDRGVDAPAIATSAEIDGSARAQLLAAGFAACMEKPVTLAQLREILRPWLRDADVPALDDAAGLSATGGDRQALYALRMMLADELSTLQNELAGTVVMPQALLERLHRLRASCGFCGAPKLAAAAIALEQALRLNSGRAQDEQRNFAACCVDTISAMRS